jgi:hypothetical protein
VLDILGLKLVYQSGAQRLPLPCPKCGAEELSASGAFPCTLSRGVNDFTAENAGEPDRFLCPVCDRVIFPDELVESKSAKTKDALVLDGPLRAFVPLPQVFVVAELDGKHSVAKTARAALLLLVDKTFALEQRLCRLRCADIEHARELVQKHASEMPFKTVQIGRDLEPLAVAWHHGRLADWEKRKLEGQAVAARVRGLANLDDELEAIRRERTAQLRTV